jgi:hypothetical protein
VGDYERVGTDIKGIRAAVERHEGGRDILASPDFGCGNLEAERAGRCLKLAHLQHDGGIIDIGHDRQPAETGTNRLRVAIPIITATKPIFTSSTWP